MAVTMRSWISSVDAMLAGSATGKVMSPPRFATAPVAPAKAVCQRISSSIASSLLPALDKCRAARSCALPTPGRTEVAFR